MMPNRAKKMPAVVANVVKNKNVGYLREIRILRNSLGRSRFHSQYNRATRVPLDLQFFAPLRILCGRWSMFIACCF